MTPLLRVHELRLPLDHADADLHRAAAERLGIPLEELLSLRVARRSVDARKKSFVHFVYLADVEVRDPGAALLRGGPVRIEEAPAWSYRFPDPGPARLADQPVVVGSGPAGLFAALLLAEAGYRPLVLERGRPLERRAGDHQ